MKAAVILGLGSIEVKDIPTPKIKPGALLIKVEVCAVCGSDVRIFESGNSRVKFPAIIGHEIAGEVVEIGKGVKGFNVGHKIAVGADVPCGKCSWCKNGMGNCCNDNYAIGYQFQGGFAQYCLLEPMVVKYGPVSLIPKGVDPGSASLAEPLGCCLNGFERVNYSKGKTVLIIGAGPIGIMLAQTANILGAPLVLLADTDQKRLDMAKKFNAAVAINSSRNDLIETVMKMTKDRGVDVAFTACPAPEAQEQAVKLISKRGHVNFFGGLPKNSRNINVSSNDIHYRELNLTGSHGSIPEQHRKALKLIASKKIDIAGLITHRFPLKDIKHAFDTVKNRQGLKVLVLPNK